MGDWRITIRGTGAHRSRDCTQDVERLMVRFADQLQAAGYTVVGATLTAANSNRLQYVVDPDHDEQRPETD